MAHNFCFIYFVIAIIFKPFRYNKMSHYIHYRTISSDHLSKSIIISQSNHPPTWMNTDQFRSNTWPTPAMRLYESIISCDFTQYYWRQDTTKREIMINSVAREIHHECDGKIYKRLPNNADILHKQTVDEFKQIIKTKLVNQRNQTEDLWNPNYYDSLFGSFTEGERVLVSSLSGPLSDGTFQFISAVNSNYCYIKFDSNNHIVRWDKNLIERINLSDYNNQRVTRQMARRQRTGRNEQDAIVLSDTEATSEHSSDGEEDSNSLNQNGMGVARARNDNNSNSFSSSDSNNRAYLMINRNDNDNSAIAVDNGMGDARARNENNPNSFSSPDSDNRAYLMINRNDNENSSGDGTENKTAMNDKWLTKQGFTINPVKDVDCVICREPIPANQMVFDIKCDGTLKHPLHTECAQQYIAKKHTRCPVCRFLWKA